MSLQHILKNSSVSGKEPLASQLANGELSINYHADGPFLCCKDTAGNVRRVAGVWVSATAPSTPFPGELWLDTGITPSQLKVYKNATDAWVFAGEVSSATTTTEGLVRLATDGETQVGISSISAVTPAGLQSKISDSTITVSSTTLASSTAVKTVGDTANAALPKSGGTITGTLEIGNTGQLRFEGSSNDAHGTTLAVEDPTATRTITLPDRTGTVITTGDTGTVTSTMLADGTIADVDINANAEIAVSKLADGAARQLLQTDAAGTGVEWTSNVDIPGTLDVTGATTLDSTLSVPLGSAAAPSINFAGDNTGIYSPGADQLAISTNGTGRLFVDADGRVRALTTGLGINGFSQTNFDLDVNGLSIFRGAVYFDSHSGISGDTTLNAPDGQSLVFKRGNVESARLDSSGRLGLGTSSPVQALHVVDTLNSSVPLLLTSSASTARMQFSSSGGGGDVYIGCSAGGFAIQTAGSGFTEKLFIDGSGRLGIGTSSPNAALHVVASTNGDQIRVGNDASIHYRIGRDSNDGLLYIYGSQSGFAGYVFSGADGERLRITSDGYLRLASGTSGIQFNGDTAAANALDDYEEGTFTPTIIGSTTTGTATYTSQIGIYTKVGRQVNFSLYIVWSGGTGTGDLRISGLPFNVANLNSWSVSFGIADNVATAANTVISGYAVQNESYVTVINTVVGGGAFSATAYDAAGTLLVTGSYAA